MIEETDVERPDSWESGRLHAWAYRSGSLRLLPGSERRYGREAQPETRPCDGTSTPCSSSQARAANCSRAGADADLRPARPTLSAAPMNGSSASRRSAADDAARSVFLSARRSAARHPSRRSRRRDREVADRTREAIELGDHECVAFARGRERLERSTTTPRATGATGVDMSAHLLQAGSEQRLVLGLRVLL